MATTTTFATASNARRAARAAGLSLDQIDVQQDGARFFYVRKGEAQADAEPAAAPEAEAPASTETVGDASALFLTDSEGNDFGPVAAADAEAMAIALATNEGKTIFVKNGQGFTVHTAEPPAPVAPEVDTSDAPEVADATADTAPAEGTSEGRYSLRDAFNRLRQGVEGEVFVVSFVIGRDTEAAAIKAAQWFAKRVDVDCMVQLAGANTATIVPAKAVKVPKTPKAPRAEGDKAPGRPKATGVSGATKLAADLAARPEGVTRQQMTDANGGKQQPWTMLLKIAEERLGLKLEIAKDDKGRATYFLRAVQ